MSLLQKASIAAWQKITGATAQRFSDLAARCRRCWLRWLRWSCWPACCGRGENPALESPPRSCSRCIPGTSDMAWMRGLMPWWCRCASAACLPSRDWWKPAAARFGLGCGGELTAFLWIWAFPNAVLDIAVSEHRGRMLLWKSHETLSRSMDLPAALDGDEWICSDLFLQVFLPNLMQARHWAGQESDQHVLILSLAAETASQLLCGRNVAETHWQLAILCGALVLMAAAFVWIFVARRTLHPGVLVLPALAVSAIIFGTLTSALGSYYYPRFVIALLPVAIAALSLALSQMSSPLPRIAAAAAFLALPGSPRRSC